MDIMSYYIAIVTTNLLLLIYHSLYQKHIFLGIVGIKGNL